MALPARFPPACPVANRPNAEPRMWGGANAATAVCVLGGFSAADPRFVFVLFGAAPGPRVSPVARYWKSGPTWPARPGG